METDPAARSSTGLRLLTFSQERAPERSVGLTTAETFEASPLAGDQALAVVSMEAVSMAAVADAIDELIEKSKNGEEHHAVQGFVFCST